jgi:two-component system, NarL family, nitrate/nitrite response regulator NarL
MQNIKINMEKIRVLVVDDHPMVLEGMKSLLANIEYVTLSGAASNAIEAMQVLKDIRVDVAIVDINLPNIDGLELTKKIKADYPLVHVLAMSTFKERSYIVQMIQNGASGYLLKSATKGEIEEAILSAQAGKLYLSLDINSVDVNQKMNSPMPIISSREKEVLKLIADGLTSPQIADKLFISLHTVDSHRKNLLTKFNVNNTASLIKLAAKHSMI